MNTILGETLVKTWVFFLTFLDTRFPQRYMLKLYAAVQHRRTYAR
jgi:hypothetical protein